MKQREFVGAELYAHLIDFFAPDAVLTGDGSADGDAQFENLAAQFLGSLELARLVRIEQDQGMHVAVPCMKYVGDLQPEAPR